MFSVVLIFLLKQHINCVREREFDLFEIGREEIGAGVPVSVQARRRIRRRACNFPYKGRVAKSGSRETSSTTSSSSSSAHPSTSATFTPRSASLRGSRRVSSDAQRILHKLRALTTDNRADPGRRPKPSFLLLTTIRPPFPPAPFPTISLRRPHHLPPAFFHPDFPFFAFRLVRQGASSGTRGKHVSARVGVACTRRYASSSTFVTSPASRSPSSLWPRSPLRPLRALRSCLPSSTTVVVRYHLSFASLLISERSCRWWSRNFRDSFLETSPPPLSPSSFPLQPSTSFFFLFRISSSSSIAKRSYKGKADSASSTESGGGERVREQGQHELHVCAAFLCLSSQDFHDLGGSTSARLEKGDRGWNRLSKSRWCSE